MPEGFVYCFHNEDEPGHYKVGMTTRSVEQRLKEANHNTYALPSNKVTVLFAKKVNNAERAEKYLHAQLDNYRVVKEREIFRVSPGVIKKEFNNLKGSWYDSDPITYSEPYTKLSYEQPQDSVYISIDHIDNISNVFQRHSEIQSSQQMTENNRIKLRNRIMAFILLVAIIAILATIIANQ